MKALVLSGGGSKGAYELGVLHYLLLTEKNSYDIITGVSVGAINAAFLAQYHKTDIVRGLDDLSAFWAQISNSKVYKNWFIPYLSALWKPSVYNTKPLHDLIKGNISSVRTKLSDVKLRIGATALNTGNYTVFDENTADLATAVLASSAFPGLLEPIEIGGQLYCDGGVRSTTPLNLAIQAGADTVDLVMCSPAQDPSNSYSTSTTALSVAARAIDLMSDQIEDNDLKVCLHHNKMAKTVSNYEKRFINLRVVRPAQVLVSNPLDFARSLLDQMCTQGFKDALATLGGSK